MDGLAKRHGGWGRRAVPGIPLCADIRANTQVDIHARFLHQFHELWQIISACKIVLQTPKWISYIFIQFSASIGRNSERPPDVHDLYSIIWSRVHFMQIVHSPFSCLTSYNTRISPTRLLTTSILLRPVTDSPLVVRLIIKTLSIITMWFKNIWWQKSWDVRWRCPTLPLVGSWTFQKTYVSITSKPPSLAFAIKSGHIWTQATHCNSHCHERNRTRNGPQEFDVKQLPVNHRSKSPMIRISKLLSLMTVYLTI